MIKINLDFLGRLRGERGLTKARLAKLAEVSKATIYRIEVGAGTTEGTAKKIADALGVTFDELTRERTFEKVPDTIRLVNVGEELAKYETRAHYGEEKMSDILTRAAKILEKPTIYRQALVANINAFHAAMHSAEILESRLAVLEKAHKKQDGGPSATAADPKTQ